jgi:histidinol-phosphatase (PHP family)
LRGGRSGKEGDYIEKGKAYREYFELVRKSVDAEYDYDILGHFTYCVRYAPYEDKRAALSEFGKEIDGVLKALIARGKILEVNSSNRGAPSEFLPSGELLARYYALGGRKVSFASDAHAPDRIIEKRDVVVNALKEIGFSFITVPVCGEYIEVEL